MADPATPTFRAPAEPVTTGRYLVLLDTADLPAAVDALRDIAGTDVATSSDFSDESVPAETVTSDTPVVFERLGVAVITAPPEATPELADATRDDRRLLAYEPERYVHALDGALEHYLRGYRDGVEHLTRALRASAATAVVPAALDESLLTWGLQRTGAAAAQYAGLGVRVAVLDTGLDLQHPDFAGRAIMSDSFVAGEAVQDRNGHGTHCIGTACGPLDPAQLPRYGIAHGAEIFAGKVLSNAGSGTDAQILAGVNWAVASGCRVASLSLGAPVAPGQPFSPVFEQAAARAMQAGTLIVAAAGNDSARAAGVLEPVSHPANCPSIMAVAAVDVDLQVADFSNAGRTPGGGEVDIAGPGVDVRSAWPVPTTYRTVSGTSMATPHVAGIAAQWLEAQPEVTASELFGLLMRMAQRLPLPSTDVGTGLVQAP